MKKETKNKPFERTKEQKEWLKGFEELFNDGKASLEYLGVERPDFFIDVPISNMKKDYSCLIKNDWFDDSDLQDIFVIREHDKETFVEFYVHNWLREKLFGFKKDIPSIKQLVENAEYILEVFENLYKKISEYVKENPYDEVFGKEQEIGKGVER